MLATRRRSTSLSDPTPVTKINKIEGMDIINLDIRTKDRFSIFADYLITETDNEKTNTKPQTENTIEHENTTSNTNPLNIKHSNVKPPPIYIHGNIDHSKLLDALEKKNTKTLWS